MHTLSKLLLLFLVLSLGYAPEAYAQKDKDINAKQSSFSVAELRAAAQRGGGPQPGSCELGTAQKDLDINNVRGRVFNIGSLFFGNGSEAQYIVPAESGLSPIYATGIWIGGQVNGELRTAGATYSNFEYWPGPLGEDGRPVNPADCSAYDRIYKVSASDIADYDATGTAAPDLADWPADLGAPVIAAPNNDVDDDGDGLIDEGTDGIDNDGDGAIDERDEQERRTDGGYDLAAGDRPEIIGDQSVWWVMNDVGNVHQFTETNPIGVEVRVQAFAFSRDNALGNTTFYKYTVIYKGTEPLEEAYLSVFSDPDLGDFQDDYVGADTSLSLGFVYNANRVDAAYGVPPAAGYDFFQGPIVDGDTLGLTSFNYFINGGPAGTADPSNGEELYNYQQGLWAFGVPMTEGGTGYQTGGDITEFAFPGDPVNEEFWSEVNTDGSGGDNSIGDRRLIVSTGPFTIEPGDQQDIVFGLVFAQGSSALSSIDALRAADITAQNAYDADFEIPEPPPAPRNCEFGATNPELQPGTGNCLEGVEVDGTTALSWGYPESSPNYLGQFSLLGYSFEGFNVYQYPTSRFDETERRLVATFDKINGITTVNNLEFDLDVGTILPTVAARGSDSGLQYYYVPTSDVFTGAPITNYRDYYYGVSAYGVNASAELQRVVESSPRKLTIRPSDVAAGGFVLQSEIGQVITGTRIGGEGVGAATAVVVDPTRLTGASYNVEIVEITPNDSTSLFTYVVSRGGEVVFDGAEVAEEEGIYISPTPITSTGDIAAIEDATDLRVFTGSFLIEGIQFVNAFFPGQEADADGLPDFAGDGAGIVEIANPNADEICGAEDNVTDIGCQFYDGNTVWHDLSGNSTDDYYVSAGGGTGGLDRISRYINFAFPDDYEMRFTDEGGLGVFAFTDDKIATVPFELWNVGPGTPDDESDDCRMIPFLLENVETTDSWQYASGENPWPEDTTSMISDWVYWMDPIECDGETSYNNFEQTAIGAGGPGAIYPAADDGSEDGYFADFVQVDPITGDEFTFVYPIGRSVLADLAGDGTPPPSGTVIRFQTVPKGEVLAAGDQFEFNTADFAMASGGPSAAEEALEQIGIVPNPYKGASLYETGNLDRRVRFTNLPSMVEIRVYTVSGTLIKTLTKEGPGRSLDWDLTTQNNLPVASGMYFIHVEARNSDGSSIGERVLKFGVVNRQIDVNVF